MMLTYSIPNFISPGSIRNVPFEGLGIIRIISEVCSETETVAGACVNVTHCEGIPATVTIIGAVLGAKNGFCWKFASIVPLPSPDGVIVSQDESLTAVQGEFEITSNAICPAFSETFWSDGVTNKVGVTPIRLTVITTAAGTICLEELTLRFWEALAWVTVTLTVLAPLAVTVMLATRADAVVFTV